MPALLPPFTCATTTTTTPLPPAPLQEVIVQNFVPKQGTAMASSPRPPLSELLWTVAMARLVLGPGMSIQAPPNLTPEPDDAAEVAGAEADPAAGWRLLLDAGINDWGGERTGVVAVWLCEWRPPACLPACLFAALVDMGLAAPIAMD